MAEIIRNVRAINITGRLIIFIGQIKATIPKIRVEVIITPPIKSPKINQSWLFLAAWEIKDNSGREFPKLTIKIPIKGSERFK